MRRVSVYLIGYVLLLGGLVLGLWKLGVLEGIEPFWLGVAALVLVGIGVMVSVSIGGRRDTIEIDPR